MGTPSGDERAAGLRAGYITKPSHYLKVRGRAGRDAAAAGEQTQNKGQTITARDISSRRVTRFTRPGGARPYVSSRQEEDAMTDSTETISPQAAPAINLERP